MSFRSGSSAIWLNLILTAPSVVYRINLTDGSTITLDNPSKLPEPTLIESIEEPYVKAAIMTPKEYIGPIMELCQEKRGIYIDLEYFDDTRMILNYELPLLEIIYNFFDKLKSFTRGYASFDYSLSDYKASRLVKLDILLNGNVVDALSSIIHRDSAFNRGNSIVRKLKGIIRASNSKFRCSRHQRQSHRPRRCQSRRKDVLAKCYGGDISRKRKLLDKQKEGKKRMKTIGSVEVRRSVYDDIIYR
jgi:GTP-binding protein LepA